MLGSACLWRWKRENGLAEVKRMAMERSCSLWRRREFWDHSVPPNTTRSTRLSLCGCDLTTSISSLRASYGNINESAQTDGLAQATIQEVLHRSRCFAHRSSRVRGFIRGWIQTAWRMDALPKKSHQRSQSTGCVLVRKAPTTLTQSGNSTVDSTQSGNSTTGQRQGASKVDRDGDSGNSLRQSVSAQSTWSGCEVELGTCHCSPYYVHLVHTRVPMDGHRRRQRIYPLWW